MQKNVITVNDELGTMALGFFKAGYNVKSIFVDYQDQKNLQVCRDNWGDMVECIGNEDCFFIKDFSSVYCIAGQIKFPTYRLARSSDDFGVRQDIHFIMGMIRNINPKCFVFKCNKIPRDSTFLSFLAEAGYDIKTVHLGTRPVTGFPVNENTSFIIGTLEKDIIKISESASYDVSNLHFESFIEKGTVENQWYYKISGRDLDNIDMPYSDCFLCWNRDRYVEQECVKWNIYKTPLIKKGDSIRKITHLEMARLKGIPDEYRLNVYNKNVLYKKLISCCNVLLIQYLAHCIEIKDDENYFSRKILKEEQFENIIFSALKENDKDNSLHKGKNNSYFDFQYVKDSIVYNFEVKIYNSNNGISAKIKNTSIKISEKTKENEKTILVVGNIVDSRIKEQIEKNYKIYVWDIENILWILRNDQLQLTNFISLLSFGVSDIVAQAPKLQLFSSTDENRTKRDYQERLRTISPGKEDFGKYESVCEEIIRYLFSENIDFYSSQYKSNAGLYRFDFCGKIKYGNISEFFDTIQRFFNTKYIIFEFKNCKEEISQKEIYTTEKYLYEKALRKVAIIISRKGPSENAIRASRGCLREQGKLIICLSDEDINKLIEMKNKNEDPTDYLENLLDNMLMDLEK